LYKLSEIALITGGRLVLNGLDRSYKGISTDSRSIKRGEIFLAIKGEQFDGQDFINNVYEKGIRAVVVSNPRKIKKQYKELSYVIVNDTIQALGDIAKKWREDNFSSHLIGITGSNGKTTCKDMTANILERRYKVLKTEGNKNNLIGLPQMLLKINPRDLPDIIVLEIGMNIKGEIQRLTQIAKPTIGMILNINPVHLEGLGSLEGIFRAKAELLEEMGTEGIKILNRDCKFYTRLRKIAKGEVITFGSDSRADVYPEGIERLKKEFGYKFNIISKIGRVEVKLKMFGKHNVNNAMAATAATIPVGITKSDIKDALNEFSPSKMRSEVKKLKNFTLIVDCYNANPEAFKLGIKELKEIDTKGIKVVVMGDMLELGVDAEKYHKDLGNEMAKAKVDMLITKGKLSKHTSDVLSSQHILTKHCDDNDEIKSYLTHLLRKDDVVFIKGSRLMKLEDVADFLEKWDGGK